MNGKAFNFKHMNYLAHAYLSFKQPELLAGNMISDFVKGKKKFDYAAGIQKGIALHRSIDTFTDAHEATKQAKEVFRKDYRLYAGAFVDVVFDHFLATDEAHFSNESLKQFATDTYAALEPYSSIFPDRFAGMFPYMKEQNWLYHYHTRWGIEKSLGGVVRRSAYLTESETAFLLFEEHYDVLKNCYDHFFSELFQFTKSEIENLNKPTEEQ
jgi:acyl carrier protein phosphodiesterase